MCYSNNKFYYQLSNNPELAQIAIKNGKIFICYQYFSAVELTPAVKTTITTTTLQLSNLRKRYIISELRKQKHRKERNKKKNVEFSHNIQSDHGHRKNENQTVDYAHTNAWNVIVSVVY